MFAIAEPQRLNRRIENAAGQIPRTIALMKRVHEFLRRCDEHASFVQVAEYGAAVVKRKDCLKAAGFGDHALEQTFSSLTVRMIEPYGRDAAETNALPFHQGRMSFAARN